MMEEKNQATKTWSFDSPLQELHFGIKIQANRGSRKIHRSVRRRFILEIVEDEDDEYAEKNQRIFYLISYPIPC